MTYDAPPWLVFAMAGLSAVLLAQRGRRKRDWRIFGAILPRLLICGVYAWIYFWHPPLPLVSLAARWALVALFFNEIAGHLFEMNFREGAATWWRRIVRRP